MSPLPVVSGEEAVGLLKRYLIAGLLVWLPLGVTIVVINFLVELFDQSLLLLPRAYRPEAFGLDIPGLGVVLSFVVILLTGLLAANFLGSKLVGWSEKLLSQIPLVRTIYNAVKQIAEAVFGAGDQTFQKVYLIEYPRKGLWTLAFQTGAHRAEPQRKTGFDEVVNLFVPTTPNPTSGFFIMANRDDVIELDLEVDDALKMVISGGVVVPPEKQKTQVLAEPASDKKEFS